MRMASSDDDFEKLMAETERMLGGPTPAKAAAPPRRAPGLSPGSGRFEVSLRRSAVSGGVAALLVFVAFAATPFLGAISGAAGAFVATFVIVLVQRISGGRKR